MIPLAENLGFAGGMNRAIAATHAPWVLSLNADARPEPDFLARLLARAASSTRAASRRRHRPPAPFAGESGERRSHRRLRHAPDLDLAPSRPRLAASPTAASSRAPERVFGGTGAATLFRREALDDVAVDGEVFDARFHSFREDAELASACASAAGR